MRASLHREIYQPAPAHGRAIAQAADDRMRHFRVRSETATINRDTANGLEPDRKFGKAFLTGLDLA
jgi:hypothetical protein